MSQYECDKCNDMGFLVYTGEDGYTYSKKCDCYEKKVALSRLKKSGISSDLQKKGFKDFEDRGIKSLAEAKLRAQKYYQGFLKNEGERHNSIIFCGQVGSGKTHLAMAVCNNLLNVCGVGVSYMAYRNAITEIKQSITDRENYWNAISGYCTTRVLCIDDLLKGRTTESDINILYEIVNYRYMHNKPVIISTEKTPEELVDYDEAIGSRVLEMCRGNIVLLCGKELNYRLYSEG